MRIKPDIVTSGQSIASARYYPPLSCYAPARTYPVLTAAMLPRDLQWYDVSGTVVCYWTTGR
eukprot:3826571-Rhodomonas_salina.7